MIKKWIEPSFGLIDEMLNFHTCRASGISFIENRDIEISKDDNQFKFTFFSSYQEHRLIDQARTSNLDQFHFSSQEKTYVVSNESRITSYRDCFEENLGFSCTISSQCIYSEDIDSKREYYFRYIIPIGEEKVDFRDYSSFSFNHYFSGNEIWSTELIKIHLNDKEYHFYNIKVENDSYLIIDSTTHCDFKGIDKIALSILVSYGFLSATIHLNEAYIIVSDEQSFTEPIGIYYKSLRNTLKGQYTIFTTNAYSVLVPIAKNRDPENGETNAIATIKEDRWSDKLAMFDEEIFSNLVQLVYDDDAILRSAMMIVEASTFAIDIQLGVYCVAFETITNQIMNKNKLKPPTIINKRVWKNNIKPKFMEIINLMNEENNGILGKEQIKFLEYKINDFNKPTNRDTLMLPFIKLEYALSKDELECIDYRNRSLHGTLPILEGENEMDKLFYVNLTFHKLCSILILKLAGFNGYIINNIKLHEQNIKRKIDLDGFVKI
jgi:hypothetical protein